MLELWYRCFNRDWAPQDIDLCILYKLESQGYERDRREINAGKVM